MKNFTLLLIALLSLSVTYAQQPHPAKFAQPQIIQVVPAALQNIISMAKTRTSQTDAERSATGSRLIAFTYYANNGTDFYPSDSAYLSYDIPSNGGDETHTLKYSTDVAWNYNTQTSAYDTDLRQTQTFDANDNIATGVVQLWDTLNHSFVNSTQKVYTYNATNDTLGIIGETWDTTTTTNKWDSSYQYSYTYDANNNRISETYQIWDGTSAWDSTYKYSYTYDAHNNETSEIDENWDGVSAWDSSYKYSYTYSAANKETSEIDENWDGVSAWDSSYKYSYTYSAANKETSEIDENWDGVSAWDSTYKYSYDYDANNNDTVEIEQIFHNDSAWVNDYKNILTYDANNNNTYELQQEWNTDSAAWINYSESFVNYNTFNQVTSGYSSTWDDSIKGWKESVYDIELFLYYQQYTTGINQLTVDGGQLTVYPNPSSDFIHANIQLNQTSDLQLRLVNMLGQTVWSADAGNVSSYQNGISVADLPDGVYLLEMVTDGGMESQKIVVAR